MAETDDAVHVVRNMRELRVSDMFARKGMLCEDGRMAHDTDLLQVKRPWESAYPRDYCGLHQTIPGAQAHLPPEKSMCA